MAFPDDTKKDGPKKGPAFGKPRGKAPTKEVVGMARKGDTGAKAALALRKGEDDGDDESFFKKLEGDESEMDMGDQLDDDASAEEDPNKAKVLDILKGDASDEQKAEDICALFK